MTIERFDHSIVVHRAEKPGDRPPNKQFPQGGGKGKTEEAPEAPADIQARIEKANKDQSGKFFA
jgi:hypothetical protein